MTDSNLEIIDRSFWHRRPQGGRAKYLNGRCFDFALVLSRYFPDGDFVVMGSAEHPEHAALRLPDGRLLDVRGVTDSLEDFYHGSNMTAEAGAPVLVDRGVLEEQCGIFDVAPPYRGCADIKEADNDIKKRFPGVVPVRVRKAKSDLSPKP